MASELQAMVDSPSADLPQDVVLGELAETLVALDRGDEAKVFYDRILDEFPDSAYAAEARAQSAGLPAS